MENRKSSTFETRSYILQHPSIRDCLSLGLINHSALARKICNERAIDKFDAVLAATKRFAAKANDRSSGEKISRLIEDAQVRVTNKIAVVVVNQAKDFEKLLSLQRAIRQARGRCNLIDGDEVITLIVSEQHLGLIKATLKNSVKTIVQGLAQINLIFDEAIETTPGVVAHFYGLLAFHGVNVREEMSCWTDLILIVDERDIAKALAVLRLGSEMLRP